MSRGIAALAAVILVTSCSSGTNDKGSGSDSAGDGGSSAAASFTPDMGAVPDVLKVGITSALTGPASESSGQEYLVGAQLAVKEINDAGGIMGHQLELEVEDDASTVATAVRLAQKFASEDIPVFLSGISDIIKAQAAVAEKEGMLLLNPVGSSSALKTAGATEFQAVPYADHGYAYLAQYMKDTDKIESIALAANQTAIGTEGIDAMKEILSDLDIKVTDTAIFPAGTTNFASYIAQLRTGNPDAIMEIASGPDGGIFIKQARAAGLDQKLYANFAFNTGSVMAAAGDGAEGVVYCSYDFRPDAYPTQAEFVTNAQALAPGVPTSSSTALNYNAIKSVLVPTIEYLLKQQGWAYTGNNLVHALQEVRTFPGGLLGDMELTDSKDMLLPTALYRVEDGKPVFLQVETVK